MYMPGYSLHLFIFVYLFVVFFSFVLFQVKANSGASAGKNGPPKLPWLVLYCGANPKVEEVRTIW